MIQLKEYREAMKVGEYNKGRGIGDLDFTKKRSDGFKDKVRPDTMWNDGRYVGVTQGDID